MCRTGYHLIEEAYPADWEAECRRCNPRHRRTGRDGTTYCPLAGHYRNADMVVLGADLCLAFYKQGAGNKGTDHCARLAEDAGIPVRRITG